MMIVLAPEIVLFLFGNKWLATVPIIQVLSLYGAVRSTGNPIGSLLLARGRANSAFYWNLGLLFYIPVGIVLACPLGLITVSWMLVALQVTLVIPGWYLLVRPLCGARLREYLLLMGAPCLLSLIAALSTYFVIYFFENGLLRFGAGLVLGFVVYIGLNWRFNRVWIIAMMELLPGRFNTKRCL